MGQFIGYVALFTKTKDGKYFVEFPDLPGCLSQGDSLEMAICNAQDALAIYYQEKNGVLPKASDLDLIQEINTNAISQLVAIDTNNYIIKSLESVKKTLTIPKWLNELSVKYEANFSQILKNALIDYLKKLSTVSSYDRKMLEWSSYSMDIFLNVEL